MADDTRTRVQLLEECERLGVVRYKSKTKAQLLQLIEEKSSVHSQGDDTAEEDEGGGGTTNEPAIRTVMGDCIAEMPKELKDRSVDLILCDLPYGMTKNPWDVVIPFDALWREYNRVIKDNGAIVLFGSQPFTSLMITSNTKMFRYCLVWEKNKFSDFLNAKRKPMKTNEDIAVFYKRQPTYNPQYWYSTPYKRWNTQEAVDKQSNYGSHKENVAESADGKRLPTTVLKFNRVERPAHPTEKPVDLLEWLIKTYSNEGDLVLDNCMGVGSTGVACVHTKRRFVGIELDPKYYELARKRLRVKDGGSDAVEGEGESSGVEGGV